MYVTIYSTRSDYLQGNTNHRYAVDGLPFGDYLGHIN